MSRKKRNLKITRDSILFAVGLLGIVHETLSAKADRPTLLLLFAGMVGLPAFIRKDELVRKEQDEHGTSTKERSGTDNGG